MSCLPIEDGDKLLHGIHCQHLYHHACIMQWMEKNQDHCPYCRVEMVTPVEMRRAAMHVLDKKRLDELSWVGCPATANRAPDMTSSPLSNVSDAISNRARTLDGSPDNDLGNLSGPLSPTLSDQAQVGLTVVTPARESPCSDPPTVSPPTVQTVSGLPDTEAGGSSSHLELVRESLDQRLASFESTDNGLN